MDKALFITDFGTELEVQETHHETGKESTWKMPRYGVWGDVGVGKPQVIETSSDLKALQRKYGELPVRKIQGTLEVESNYGDPFAQEMEEFVKNREQSPQEKLEEKSEEQGLMPEALKEESPQEKLEKKLEKQGSENPEIREISPQEKLEKKLEQEGSENPELVNMSPQEKLEFTPGERSLASISRIAAEVAGGGHPELANRILVAAGLDVAELLQDLLIREYEQRDLYESYDYLLLGPEAIAVQEHLQEHLAQEMEHIRILQRYLTHMNVIPTLHRLPIPRVEPLNCQGILAKDLELEKAAVELYSAAIHRLENLEEWTALRVDLENILSDEQEHVHDIERWLKEYSEIKP